MGDVRAELGSGECDVLDSFEGRVRRFSQIALNRDEHQNPTGVRGGDEVPAGALVRSAVEHYVVVGQRIEQTCREPTSQTNSLSKASEITVNIVSLYFG